MKALLDWTPVLVPALLVIALVALILDMRLRDRKAQKAMEERLARRREEFQVRPALARAVAEAYVRRRPAAMTHLTRPTASSAHLADRQLPPRPSPPAPAPAWPEFETSAPRWHFGPLQGAGPDSVAPSFSSGGGGDFGGGGASSSWESSSGCSSDSSSSSSSSDSSGSCSSNGSEP